MGRRFALSVGVALVVLLGSSCQAESGDNDAAPTSAAGANVGAAPTEAAISAVEAFGIVLDGYADCGRVVLTSGWPTTTAYLPGFGDCIIDASESGDRAQYVYWGRDDFGGVEGTVLRVDGPADITMIDFSIGPDGVLESAETGCSGLTAGPAGPPTCDG